MTINLLSQEAQELKKDRLQCFLRRFKDKEDPYAVQAGCFIRTRDRTQPAAVARKSVLRRLQGQAEIYAEKQNFKYYTNI